MTPYSAYIPHPAAEAATPPTVKAFIMYYDKNIEDSIMLILVLTYKSHISGKRRKNILNGYFSTYNSLIFYIFSQLYLFSIKLFHLVNIIF